MGNCVQTSQHYQLQQEVKAYLIEKGFQISEQIVAKLKDIDRVIIATKDSRKIAFKVRYFQSKLQLKEYQEQAIVLKRFVHPNIVQFEDYFNSSHVFFMQMEYCPSNLRQLLKERRFTQQEQFDFIMQVIRGVEAIHSINHTHKELKTQNILVNQQGNLVIGDFGLDREDDIFFQKCQSQDDLINSQRWYVAPEIQMGQPGILQNINVHADIWSIGIIILEILGMKYVSNFVSIDQLQQTLDKLYNQDFTFIDFVDKFLLENIKALLHPEPQKRPSIEEVKRMFQKEIDVRIVAIRQQTDVSDDLQSSENSFCKYKVVEVPPEQLISFLNGDKKDDDSIRRVQLIIDQQHQMEIYALMQCLSNLPSELVELNLSLAELSIDGFSVREFMLQIKNMPNSLLNLILNFRNISLQCDQTDFYQNLFTKIPDRVKYLGLYLEKQTLNKKVLKDLAASLKQLPTKIQSLTFGFYQNIFSQDSFKYISLIFELLPQQLRSFEFNIENNPDISTGNYQTLFSSFGQLPITLSTLYISLQGNLLKEESIEIICQALKRMHRQISLFKLDLSKSIHDCGTFTRLCFHLPQIVHQQIEKLCLSFKKCNLGDEDLEKLCDTLLKSSNYLTQIEVLLDENKFTNVGFSRLVQYIMSNRKTKFVEFGIGQNDHLKSEEIIEIIIKLKEVLPKNYQKVSLNFGDNYMIRQGLIEGEHYTELENSIIKVTPNFFVTS